MLRFLRILSASPLFWYVCGVLDGAFILALAWYVLY
jgi:hypothetical protein